MINLKNKSTLLIIILGINLFLSNIALGLSSTQGSIAIGKCVSTKCLDLIFPYPHPDPEITSLQNPTVSFIDTNNKNIFFHTTSILQGLTVYDSKETGGFTIDANITPFKNTVNSSQIDYTNIGIISFVNSNSNSIDSNPTDLDILSNIDPVQRGIISKPFSSTELLDLENLNNNSILNKYFYFGGSSPGISDTKTLVNASNTGYHLGIHNLGIGLIIRIPPNAPTFITDGIYQSTLTLTLIAT